MQILISFLLGLVVKQPSPLPCANPKLIKMNGEWKGTLILKLLWMVRNRSLILNGFPWLSVENELISLVKSYGTNATASNFLKSMEKHVQSHMWDFEGVLLWAFLLSISILHRQVKGFLWGETVRSVVACICEIRWVPFSCSKYDRKECLFIRVCIGKQ